MTRRERHIAILKRLKHPYGGIGYEVGTDADIEKAARDAVWWDRLHKHNLRVWTSWIPEAPQ